MYDRNINIPVGRYFTYAKYLAMLTLANFFFIVAVSAYMGFLQNRIDVQQTQIKKLLDENNMQWSEMDRQAFALLPPPTLADAGW